MTALKRLANLLRQGGGIVILALLFTQIVVVALRYVFSLGWSWAMDLLVYLFFFSVLLPMLMVLIGNATVRVDVFYAGWTARRRRVVDRVALLLLFCPAMAYAAWTSLGTTMSSWRVFESSPTFGGLPGYFLLKTGLTLLFSMLAIVGVVMALRREPYKDAASEDRE